ncbi:hypothetical protein [Gimesia aquarii]|uniref:Cytochrome c domain-containing protein n=1 Tax=Gimesia aquarii TaxID=2527964 RepID=A0A517VT84_9PLAN|nr:hypothetical protein [Gimesia aquarii]QDT96169.1 hypothetical protein V144x_16220 [Gimesia aquarii]
MRNIINIKTALLFGFAVAGLSLIYTSNEVEARPNFKKIWAETYPNSKMLVAKKCGVCHPGKTKKEKNAYAQAVGKGLGKRKQTDKEIIVKALKAAENMPSPVEGKTFGDFIKADEQPPSKKG